MSDAQLSAEARREPLIPIGQPPRNYLSTAIQKPAARDRAEAVRITRDKGWR